MSTFGLPETSDVAVNQQASAAVCGSEASPRSFLEACHLPASTRPTSATGSAVLDSAVEGQTRRPHSSKPTMHRELNAESELDMAWQAAHSQLLGLAPDSGERLGHFLPGGALTPLPAVPLPSSPPEPEPVMLERSHSAWDAAEHLLRQQRLQQPRQYQQQQRTRTCQHGSNVVQRDCCSSR